MKSVSSVTCGLPFCQRIEGQETRLSIALRVSAFVIGGGAVFLGILIIVGVPGILGTAYGWTLLSSGIVLVLTALSIKQIDIKSKEEIDDTKKENKAMRMVKGLGFQWLKSSQDDRTSVVEEKKDVSIYSETIDDTKIEKVHFRYSNKSGINLEITEKDKSSFESLGFQWIESSQDDQTLIEIQQPLGWQADERYVYDVLTITLRDSQNIPRITISTKNNFFDSWTCLNFISEVAGKKRLENEIEIKASQIEKKQKFEISRELVLSQRSEFWSADCSYGVFYIKDVSDYVRSGYEVVINPFTKEEYFERFGCHGYFSSKEIAEKAVEFLEESSSYEDKIFFEDVVSEGALSIIQKKYLLVNGFEEPDWWSASTYPRRWSPYQLAGWGKS